MDGQAFQEQGTVRYCHGCGADNQQGLRIKSYWDGEESMRWLVLKDGVVDLEDVHKHGRMDILPFSPWHASTMSCLRVLFFYFCRWHHGCSPAAMTARAPPRRRPLASGRRRTSRAATLPMP